jgi:hypothetical protein
MTIRNAPGIRVGPVVREWADHKETPPEVSVVMPCLNEAETLAICIRKATLALVRERIDGEVIVADNGSTTASDHCAAGGCLTRGVTARGYGASLMAASQRSGQ